MPVPVPDVYPYPYLCPYPYPYLYSYPCPSSYLSRGEWGEDPETILSEEPGST